MASLQLLTLVYKAYHCWFLGIAWAINGFISLLQHFIFFFSSICFFSWEWEAESFESLNYKAPESLVIWEIGCIRSGNELKYYNTCNSHFTSKVLSLWYAYVIIISQFHFNCVYASPINFLTDRIMTLDFHVCVVLEFVIGFLGFFGTLLLIRKCRYDYFNFWDDIIDKFFILIVVNMRKLKWRLRN